MANNIPSEYDLVKMFLTLGSDEIHAVPRFEQIQQEFLFYFQHIHMNERFLSFGKCNNFSCPHCEKNGVNSQAGKFLLDHFHVLIPSSSQNQFPQTYDSFQEKLKQKDEIIRSNNYSTCKYSNCFYYSLKEDVMQKHEELFHIKNKFIN
eukprot:Anaeramoba_ignava/a217756_13.p2 GENE.a217756_13~~a217756_13.p2  ORF type:complete len:149 (-),score=46.05 a217756_13:2-448(-)